MTSIDPRDTQLRHQISNLSIGEGEDAEKFSKIDFEFEASDVISGASGAPFNVYNDPESVTKSDGLKNDFIDNFGEALGLSATSFYDLTENEQDLIKLILSEAAEIADAKAKANERKDGTVTAQEILESSIEVLERYDDDDTTAEGRQTTDAGDTEHDTTLMRDKQLRDDLTVRLAESETDIEAKSNTAWKGYKVDPKTGGGHVHTSNMHETMVDPDEFLKNPPPFAEDKIPEFYHVAHYNLKDTLGLETPMTDEDQELIYTLTAEAIEIIDAKALEDGKAPNYAQSNFAKVINDDILERYDGDSDYGDTGVKSSNDLNYQNMFEPIDSGTAVHLGLEALDLSETTLEAPENYTNGNTEISSENLTQLKYGVTLEEGNPLEKLSEGFDAAYGNDLKFGTPPNPTPQQEALRDNILLEAAEKAKEAADSARDFDEEPLTVEEILAQVPAVVEEAKTAKVNILDGDGKISKEIGGNQYGHNAYANISRMFGNLSEPDEHGNRQHEPLTPDQAKAFFNQIREEINEKKNSSSFTKEQLNDVIDLLGEDGNIDFNDFHHIMNYVEVRTATDLMTGHGVEGSTHYNGDKLPDKTKFVSKLLNNYEAKFTLDPYTNQPTKIELFKPGQTAPYKTHPENSTVPVPAAPELTKEEAIDADEIESTTYKYGDTKVVQDATGVTITPLGDDTAAITFDAGAIVTTGNGNVTVDGTVNGVKANFDNGAIIYTHPKNASTTVETDLYGGILAINSEQVVFDAGATSEVTPDGKIKISGKTSDNGVHTTIVLSDDADEIESTTYTYGDTTVVDDSKGVTVTPLGDDTAAITFDAGATVTPDEGGATISGTVNGVATEVVLSGSGEIESTTYTYDGTTVVENADGVTVTPSGKDPITFDAGANVTSDDDGTLTIDGNDKTATVGTDGTVTLTGQIGGEPITAVYNPNGTSTLRSDHGDIPVLVEMDEGGNTVSRTYTFGDTTDGTTVVQDADDGVTVTPLGNDTAAITFDAGATVTPDEGGATISGTVNGVDTTYTVDANGTVTPAIDSPTVTDGVNGRKVLTVGEGDDARTIRLHANGNVNHRSSYADGDPEPLKLDIPLNQALGLKTAADIGTHLRGGDGIVTRSDLFNFINSSREARGLERITGAGFNGIVDAAEVPGATPSPGGYTDAQIDAILRQANLGEDGTTSLEIFDLGTATT